MKITAGITLEGGGYTTVLCFAKKPENASHYMHCLIFSFTMLGFTGTIISGEQGQKGKKI
jgi:hypothetical protein